MNSYLLTPRAKIDIFKIWSYIARDSESAADRVEQAIYAACSSIARDPMHGHLRQNLTSRPLRFWTLTRYPNYSVAYRPDSTPVEIVAVIHGRRDISRLLRRR
jgi:antitoxin ParD1/3/4